MPFVLPALENPVTKRETSAASESGVLVNDSFFHSGHCHENLERRARRISGLNGFVLQGVCLVGRNCLPVLLAYAGRESIRIESRSARENDHAAGFRIECNN